MKNVNDVVYFLHSFKLVGFTLEPVVCEAVITRFHTVIRGLTDEQSGKIFVKTAKNPYPFDLLIHESKLFSSREEVIDFARKYLNDCANKVEDVINNHLFLYGGIRPIDLEA